MRPAEAPPLRSGEAHVWRIGTDVSDAILERMQARLVAAERARAERIRHAGARRGFVVARASLRALLGQYLATTTELELQLSPYGKPQLSHAHAGRVHFSVAHSGDLAMLAFGTADLGVDIERIRPVPRSGQIIGRVFSASTKSVLETLAAEERWPAFFAAWTQREALVKAVGGGMFATVDPLDFVWPAPAAPRRVVATGEAGEVRTWTVAHLAAASSFAAALVVAAPIDRIRLLALSGE
jgi:4'-phosphopantetheinyl transferase